MRIFPLLFGILSGYSILIPGNVYALKRPLAIARFIGNGQGVVPSDSSRFRYESPSATKPLEEHIFSGHSGSCYLFRDVTFQYDDEGRLMAANGKIWDQDSRSFITEYQKESVQLLDEGTLIATMRSPEGDALRDDYRNIESFDKRGALISMTLQLWSDGRWNNYAKTIYTRSKTGIVLTERSQTWNSTHQHWQNKAMSTHFYAGEDLIRSETQLWNTEKEIWINRIQRLCKQNSAHLPVQITDNSWSPERNDYDPYMQTNYLYNPSGSEISAVTALWSKSANSYVNDHQTKKTYTADNDLLTEEYLIWDGASWGYDYRDFRNVYYYEELQPTTAQKARNNRISVYPNPAKDYLSVSIDSGGQNVMNLSLINMQGKVCAMVSGTAEALNRTKIPVALFADGIYFLQVSNAHGPSQQKTVLIRH